MYALVERLDRDSLARICRQAFAEMRDAGTTAVGEFHYLHHERPDDFAFDDVVLAAAAEVGIRIVLLQTFYATGGYRAPPRRRSAPVQHPVGGRLPRPHRSARRRPRRGNPVGGPSGAQRARGAAGGDRPPARGVARAGGSRSTSMSRSSRVRSTNASRPTANVRWRSSAMRSPTPATSPRFTAPTPCLPISPGTSRPEGGSAAAPSPRATWATVSPICARCRRPGADSVSAPIPTCGLRRSKTCAGWSTASGSGASSAAPCPMPPARSRLRSSRPLPRAEQRRWASTRDGSLPAPGRTWWPSTSPLPLCATSRPERLLDAIVFGGGNEAVAGTWVGGAWRPTGGRAGERDRIPVS